MLRQRSLLRLLKTNHYYSLCKQASWFTSLDFDGTWRLCAFA
jgi:hypothetical protein